MLDLFPDPDPGVDRQSFLGSTLRVAFSVTGPLAEEFEEEFRDQFGAMVVKGLDAFEKRIASMMVFVGQDRKERRLIEE